jgi:hypothetical protein
MSSNRTRKVCVRKHFAFEVQPPRSLDFVSSDCYVWGYLKILMCRYRLQSKIKSHFTYAVLVPVETFETFESVVHSMVRVRTEVAHVSSTRREL